MSDKVTIDTGKTLIATESAGSPFSSAMIGGLLGASWSLTATATKTSSAASSITGLVQTTARWINTGL